MRRIVIAILVLLSASAIYANDSQYIHYPHSGEIYPVKSTPIQMVYERITYRTNQFTTIFFLSNTSSRRQKITIGFPLEGIHRWQASLETYEEELNLLKKIENKSKDEKRRVLNKWNNKNLSKAIKYFRFKSFLNHVRFKRKAKILKKDKNGFAREYCYIADYTFRPHQLVIISNTYHQKPQKDSGLADGGGIYREEYLCYILVTGRVWHEAIKAGDFEFHIPRHYYGEDTENGLNSFGQIVPSVNSLPDNFKIIALPDEYIISASLSNYEPEANIRIKWEYKKYFEINYTDWEFPKRVCKIINTKANTKYRDFWNINNEDEDEDDLRFSRPPSDFGLFRSFCYDYASMVIDDVYSNPKHLKEYSYPFIVNSFYALHGYKFKNKGWQTFFSIFPWYQPINDKVLFSKKEKSLITQLKTLHKKAYAETHELEFLD